MGFRFFFYIGFIFFVSSSSFAAEPTGAKVSEEKKAEGEVVCTHQDDQRKLWVTSEGSGCKVNYLKGGQITIIGSQKNGTDFCERLIDKVKTKLSNLPDSRFQCN